MFLLKFSNVPISQFYAKLSNLRMKIKEWYWTVTFMKGIRIFLFLMTWIHYKASPCLSCSIRWITSYNYTDIPYCNEKVALQNYLPYIGSLYQYLTDKKVLFRKYSNSNFYTPKHFQFIYLHSITILECSDN
jgi:hypothetical protein